VRIANELVSYELADGVATMVLDNGKANAISYELIKQINQCLDRAEADQAPVVMTSKGKIFSAGYDLQVMNQGMQAAMGLVNLGSELSRRLLSFPHPVVAACNGHAMAKGAFLLLSADMRIGIKGPYKIGLNEVAIGLALHHAGIAIAEYRLSPNYFQRSVLCAEIFNPEDARQAGFLDIVVEESQLLSSAHSIALQLKGLNTAAFKDTKLKVRACFLARLDKAIGKDSGSLE